LRKKLFRVASIYLPPILYAGMIFTLSSRSFESVHLEHGLDKGVHLLLYTGFGVLVYRTFHKSHRGRMAPFWTVLIVFLYGVSDEFHQFFVPGRTFEIADMVADGLGGLLSVLLCKLAGHAGWPLWF